MPERSKLTEDDAQKIKRMAQEIHISSFLQGDAMKTDIHALNKFVDSLVKK